MLIGGDGLSRLRSFRQGLSAKLTREGLRRVANTNFEPTEISEAIPIAIKDDWNAEGCDQTVRELRAILEDNRQGSLFGQEREDKIGALKDVSAAGFPFTPADDPGSEKRFRENASPCRPNSSDCRSAIARSCIDSGSSRRSADVD